MTEHDVTTENRRNFSCFFSEARKSIEHDVATHRTDNWIPLRPCAKRSLFEIFEPRRQKTTGFKTFFNRNKISKKRIESTHTITDAVVGLVQRTGIISTRKTVRKPSVSSGRGPMTRRRSSSFKNAARPLVRRQQLLITFSVGPRLSVDAANDTRSRLSRESSFSFFFVTFFFFVLFSIRNHSPRFFTH